MLSARATEWLEQICDANPADGYKVREWSELIGLLPDLQAEEAQALWKQLRSNDMVQVKYEDENEVCFALYERARSLVQDVKSLRDTRPDAEQAEIRTGADGKAVMIVPKEQIANEIMTNTRMSRNIRSALWGLLGGLIGGIGAGAGIAYLIVSAMI